MTNVLDAAFDRFVLSTGPFNFFGNLIVVTDSALVEPPPCNLANGMRSFRGQLLLLLHPSTPFLHLVMKLFLLLSYFPQPLLTIEFPLLERTLMCTLPNLLRICDSLRFDFFLFLNHFLPHLSVLFLSLSLLPQFLCLLTDVVGDGVGMSLLITLFLGFDDGCYSDLFLFLLPACKFSVVGLLLRESFGLSSILFGLLVLVHRYLDLLVLVDLPRSDWQGGFARRVLLLLFLLLLLLLPLPKADIRPVVAHLLTPVSKTYGAKPDDGASLLFRHFPATRLPRSCR